MADSDEERYALPASSRVDRGPFEGDNRLVVRAHQHGSREMHFAWAIDFPLDYASDDEDFDTAAEIQSEINTEWGEITVVWMFGDRGLPEDVPAESVEVVRRNEHRRSMRMRRMPNRYSEGRNAARRAGIDRAIRREREALEREEAAAAAREDGGAANNNVIEILSSDEDDADDEEDAVDDESAGSVEVIELLSSSDDDEDNDGNDDVEPAFPTYYDADVAQAQLRKLICRFVDEMTRRQIAQLMGRMYRTPRGDGGKTSGMKRKSAE